MDEAARHLAHTAELACKTAAAMLRNFKVEGPVRRAARLPVEEKAAKQRRTGGPPMVPHTRQASGAAAAYPLPPPMRLRQRGTGFPVKAFTLRSRGQSTMERARAMTVPC